MWTRGELKRNAKLVLRRTYWLSFALCLAGGILMAVSGMSETVNTMQLRYNINIPLNTLFLFSLLGALYGIFISNPINVGINNFFMTSREYDASFGRLFSAFSGNYLNAVKIMFFEMLYVFLWYLLFIIPGFIKSYEYFFIPYILAENPDLPKERVFQLSKDMTRGYKFDIFVLQLSFFGWTLLGLLACGVGLYFVSPYIQATFAELYAAQRSYALSNGYATEKELIGFHNQEM